jgi:hypothetical protein
MGYGLSAGTSFCDAGGRFLFLDLPSDRYFCLGDALEASFARLVAGGDLSAMDIAALDQLVARGTLICSEEAARPRACAAPETPLSSYLDQRHSPSLPAQVARATATLFRTKAALRFGRLAAVIDRIGALKAGHTGTPPVSPEVVGTVAHAFEKTALLASPTNQCLPRSLAIADQLFSMGIDADLVIGVKLRPFGAHCWVQHKGRLINDRPDRTRNFTPILVL